MNNLPIITLEVERMKHTLHCALAEHASLMSTSVKEAIDTYCTPENINVVVQQEVKRQLDTAVKEEIRSFFAGSTLGRLAVKEAVYEHMNNWCSGQTSEDRVKQLQARLDEIMFEYCPEEMTKEQLAEYEKSVKVVDK